MSEKENQRLTVISQCPDGSVLGRQILKRPDSAMESGLFFVSVCHFMFTELLFFQLFIHGLVSSCLPRTRCYLESSAFMIFASSVKSVSAMYESALGALFKRTTIVVPVSGEWKAALV